jgi:hypothetical protein
MNLLLLSVSDWPIIMISPGGLLLVCTTYFLSWLQLYGWAYKKEYN